LNVDTVFPLLARGGLDEANDPATVLHSRVQDGLLQLRATPMEARLSSLNSCPEPRAFEILT
jgi:hypothetical protein